MTQASPGTITCKALKNRGIIVSVLNIPYQTIDPVNTSFAGNEDTYANTNIQYIEQESAGLRVAARCGGQLLLQGDVAGGNQGFAERDVQPLAADRPHHQLRAGRTTQPVVTFTTGSRR